jgi:hypothetical protein
MWHNQPNRLISLYYFGVRSFEINALWIGTEERMDTKYPFWSIQMVRKYSSAWVYSL